MSHRNINTQIERNKECLKKNQINLRKILTKRRLNAAQNRKFSKQKFLRPTFGAARGSNAFSVETREERPKMRSKKSLQI